MKRILDVIAGKERSPLTEAFSVLHGKEHFEPFLLSDAKRWMKRTDKGLYLACISEPSDLCEMQILLALNNTFWWKTYGGEVGHRLFCWRDSNEHWMRRERFYFRSAAHMKEFVAGEGWLKDGTHREISRFENTVKERTKNHIYDLIKVGVARKKAGIGGRIRAYLNSQRGVPFIYAMRPYRSAISFVLFPDLQHLERQLIKAYWCKIGDPPLWDRGSI